MLILKRLPRFCQELFPLFVQKKIDTRTPVSYYFYFAGLTHFQNTPPLPLPEGEGKRKFPALLERGLEARFSRPDMGGETSPLRIRNVCN